MPPYGNGPSQQKVHNRGNAYIRSEFPLIDFIYSCSIVPSDELSEKNENESEGESEVENESERENVVEINELKLSTSHNSLRQELKTPEQLPLQPPPPPPPPLIESLSDLTTSDKSSSITTSFSSDYHTAFHAILFLVVAITVLFCLYHFKGTPLSPKSL